jgi:hypothetical protein
MNVECNADQDHPCDADDGKPCADCVAWRDASMADALREYQVMSPAERNPEQYERDMIDAGRGHLLPR